MKEFQLRHMWKSPNATIRHELDGALFSEPIIFRSIPRQLKNWRDPIYIARYSHGDQYTSVDEKTQRPGVLQMSFTPDDGSMG